MRILVYGFGPYRRFSANVTQQVLRRLTARPELHKIVFPVKFHRAQFIKTINRVRPDLIIGLGQCSRGRLLRIETRAVNRRRDIEKGRVRAISAGAAPKLFTNLRLPLGDRTRRSRNAGQYVCNYSMYVILEYLLRRRLSIRYGFIHIPYDYDPGKAAKRLKNSLAKFARNASVQPRHAPARSSNRHARRGPSG